MRSLLEKRSTLINILIIPFKYKGLMKRIIKGNIKVKPFRLARIDRAKNAVKKKKDYYRTNLSYSVKATVSPMKDRDDSDFMHSFNNYFHHPPAMERRFCPPVHSPTGSFGRHTKNRFSEIIMSDKNIGD
mmetsp:Transcript_1211/g.1094  ORF Transcript_1211/g.1094 Transcript_1211/m.1094 type:complete len:130 (+) Transcript_1211:892-1281(+)